MASNRGSREYMSSVQNYGSNLGSANNYLQNYQSSARNLYDNKLADYREKANTVAMNAIQSAQQKYQGSLVQAQEVIESSAGAYGAVKGLQSARSKYVKFRDRTGSSAEDSTEEAGTQGEAGGTVAEELGTQAEEATQKVSQAVTAQMEDLGSQASEAMQGFSITNPITGESTQLSGGMFGDVATTYGRSSQVQPVTETGEAEEASALETGATTTEEASTGASVVTGAGLDASALEETAKDVGTSILKKGASMLLGDEGAVLGLEVVAEAVPALGALAGIGYGIYDLVKHKEHPDHATQADIDKSLPSKIGSAPTETTSAPSSYNQARNRFISPNFDSVTDTPASISAF